MNALLAKLVSLGRAMREVIRAHTAITALIALILLCLAAVGFFGMRYLALSEDPALVAERQIDDAVRKVSRFIEVPEGETPTFAVVRDTASLKDDPFFANAREGDIVLYYPLANVAYIYRPSRDILVNASTEGGSL